MKIIQEINLPYFEFWSGAKSNAEELSYDQLEQLEYILEDAYPDGMTDTELNDLMWFEFDTIKEWLGIEDEDDEDFEESYKKRRNPSLKEYINDVEDEKFIHKIARKLGLDASEKETFIHDVNNLRGDEWINEVKAECPQYLDRFKKIAEIEDDEDFDEACHKSNKSKKKSKSRKEDIKKVNKLTIKEDTNKPYMYFTKHGLGPGMLPSDVKVIDWYDVNNNITIIYTDRFLTTKELEYYDVYPETMNDKLLDRFGLEVDEVTGKVYEK